MGRPLGSRDTHKRARRVYEVSVRARVATTPRYCLRCEQPFLSTGRQHRLCGWCRAHSITGCEGYALVFSERRGALPRAE